MRFREPQKILWQVWHGQSREYLERRRAKIWVSWTSFDVFLCVLRSSHPSPLSRGGAIVWSLVTTLGLSVSVCRLVAYARRASVAQVLQAKPGHSMFGDSLIVSPVIRGPTVQFDGQLETANTSHQFADNIIYIRYCSLHASQVAGNAVCLAMFCQDLLLMPNLLSIQHTWQRMSE